MKQTTLHHSTIVSILGLLLLTTGSRLCQGVIPGSIVFSQPAAAPPGTYLMANAYPAGPNGGFFVLSLSSIAPGQYELGTYGIAEAYSLHTASLGMVFTPAHVAGDTPLLDNFGTRSTYQFSLGFGESKLFAYWDDNQHFGNSPPPGALPNAADVYDAYGWFRLTRSPSALVISDSATAMGGGIIVGTYTAVPEPTSVALGLLAALGIALRRR